MPAAWRYRAMLVPSCGARGRASAQAAAQGSHGWRPAARPCDGHAQGDPGRSSFAERNAGRRRGDLAVVVNGRTLLFHQAILDQLARLDEASARARQSDPKNFRANANVKLFAAPSKLIFETIPADPGRPEYRQETPSVRKLAISPG